MTLGKKKERSKPVGRKEAEKGRGKRQRKWEKEGEGGEGGEMEGG